VARRQAAAVTRRTVAAVTTEQQGDTMSGKRGSSSGGDAVYGMGLVGALVWTWQQADGLGEHVVGILKSLVWPAFLVYDAFQALGG
jgi:hypothetical protein